MDEAPICFGNYQIEEEIGTGGMGVVFRARHRFIEDRVAALKVIHSHLLSDDAAKERFKREANVASSVRHPSIVEVYEFGEDDGRYYLAMEYLEGTPLDRVVERQTIPTQNAIKMLDKLGNALDLIHSRGYVHRDLKPDNIIVSKTGHVTIIDFGIARAVLGGTLSQLIGTPNYIAPELLQGAKLSPQVDRYSLGVIAYELLSGRRPFVGANPGQVLMNIANEPAPDPRTFCETMPHSVAEALLRQLSKNPADRFVTVEQFVNALKTGYATAGDQLVTGERGAYRPNSGQLASGPVVIPGAFHDAHSAMPKSGPVEAPAPPPSAMPVWKRAAIPVAIVLAIGAALFGYSAMSPKGGQATNEPVAAPTVVVNVPPTVAPTQAPPTVVPPTPVPPTPAETKPATDPAPSEPAPASEPAAAQPAGGE